SPGTGSARRSGRRVVERVAEGGCRHATIRPLPRGSPELRLQRAEWAAAFLITLFAVGLHGLRLVHAGPLWRDEAAAFHLATSPTLGEVIARHESFPPPFFLIVRAWAAVLGGSDHALRLFGLLVGLGLLALFWWTVRHTAGTVPLL